MQALDWHDLRYLLALCRGESLAAAARALRVDETTVGRRLRSLEAALGARLFQRRDGRLLATEAGEAALAHAERIEREVQMLEERLAGRDASVAGRVRLTAVPLLVNRLLVPAAPRLLARHPDLALDVVGEPRNLNLTRREADVALRLARPRLGGRDVLARCVGRLDYGVYAPAGAAEPDVLPWVSYDESLDDLPQTRWMERAGGRRSGLSVHDAEAAVAAVRAGLGRSLLPLRLLAGEPGLRLCAPVSPALSRPIWLLVHAELRPLGRIAAVLNWLEETLAAAGLSGPPR